MATPRCAVRRRQRRGKEKQRPQGVCRTFLPVSLLLAQGPPGFCCPFLACVLDCGPLFLTLNAGLHSSLPSEGAVGAESPAPASAHAPTLKGGSGLTAVSVDSPTAGMLGSPEHFGLWGQPASSIKPRPSSCKLPPPPFLGPALGHFPSGSDYICSALPRLMFRKTSDPSL